MRFEYSSVIAGQTADGDFLVLRRPEVAITVISPAGEKSYYGLVDTGSDHTILPKSIAEGLEIEVQPAGELPASAFGGQKLPLLTGEVTFRLSSEGESLTWRTVVSFFDFPAREEETVILGHSGFLDYFTAVFDGELGELTLEVNSEFPNVAD